MFYCSLWFGALLFFLFILLFLSTFCFFYYPFSHLCSHSSASPLHSNSFHLIFAPFLICIFYILLHSFPILILHSFKLQLTFYLSLNVIVILFAFYSFFSKTTGIMHIKPLTFCILSNKLDTLLFYAPYCCS